MRNYSLVLLIIVLGLLFIGCSNETPWEDPPDRTAGVRFQNNSDFTLLYGIKFGNAEYRGVVAPGFVSQYFTIVAGLNILEKLDENGNWINIATSFGAYYLLAFMSVTAGYNHTILMTGTGGSYFWDVIQDS